MATPTLRVSIAWSTAITSAPPTRGHASWTDVTNKVKAVGTRSGLNFDTGAIEASTATITLENSDGRFTQENDAGIYYPNVRPFKWTLIEATLDGGTTWNTLFIGIISTISPTWYMRQGGHTVIECVDTMRLMVLTTISMSRPAEPAGQRMGAIHNASNLPVTLSSSLSAGVTVAAKTYTSVAVIDAYREVLAADGGMFKIGEYEYGSPVYVGGNSFTARDHWIADAGYYASQATFGEDYGSGELPYSECPMKTDEALIFNKIDGQASGVSITTEEDTDSQALYGVRPYDFGDTIAVGTDDLTVRARDALLARKNARLRAEQMKVNVYNDTCVDNATVFALRRGNRVEVIRRPDQGSPVSGEFLVDRIAHDITVSPESWFTTFGLSAAPPSYWILGHSRLGQSTYLGWEL